MEIVQIFEEILQTRKSMDFRIANWIYRVHRVAPADFDMGYMIFLNGFPKYDTILYIMKN